MSYDERRFHPPGLTFLPDISPARWVQETLGQEFGEVAGFIPRGFASYARLFHPARNRHAERVRWADVAAWSGRVVHPLMAFECISAPRAGFGAGVAPWSKDPPAGSLDRDDAAALADFLAKFTDTPEHCFFAVWEGYGQFTPGAMAILSASGGEPQFPPEEVVTAARLRGVGRDYVLYAGPLSAVTSFFVDFWNDSPSIWWPEDQEWCIATDIDLNSTYVGGTEPYIEALIGHPRFEALPTTLDASVSMTADTLNGHD